MFKQQPRLTNREADHVAARAVGRLAEDAGLRFPRRFVEPLEPIGNRYAFRQSLAGFGNRRSHFSAGQLVALKLPAVVRIALAELKKPLLQWPRQSVDAC